MANKSDRLNNLFKSMGAPTQEQPQEVKQTSTTDETRVPSELVKELGIPPEMEEKLNAARLSKRGRPKGRKNGKPHRQHRATFIVDEGVTRKIKYIALMETRTYTEVVDEALQAYITRWEKKNGEINLPNK